MITDPNLTRRCTIHGIAIRTDGLASTFDTSSWLDFCRIVVETATGIWAGEKGIARVFGCEDGRDLEEHTVADCRRVVEQGTEA